MRQSYRIIWNTVVTWVLRVLRLIPEIIFLPFLVHRIGESLFGIYVLTWSVIPIFDLLQNGLSVGITKYCAEFFEKKDYAGVNKILSSTCLMLTIAGVAGFISVFALAYGFPGALQGVSHENAGFLRFGLITVSIMLMCSFPLLPYTGILLSLQRHDIFNSINTGSAYLRVFGIMSFFLIYKPSFMAMMLISAIMYFLSNLTIALVTCRLVPQLKIRLKFCNCITVKMMLGFGSLLFLWSLCRVVNVTGVSWMMGALAGPAFVGIMAIMLKPATLIGDVVQAMSLTVTPATSRYASLNDHRMLRELLTRSTRYITFVVMTAMMAMVLMARPILGIWMGSEYEYLHVYVIVLSGGMSILMSASAAHHMLEGMGLLRACLFSAVMGLVVVAILSILTIFWLTDSAYWAVVLGLSLGQVVTAMIQIRVILRTLSVNMWSFLWHAYGEVLILALPITAVAYYYCLRNSADSLLSRTIAVIIAITVFVGLFMLVFITDKEQNMMRDITGVLSNKLLRKNKTS